ncbi:hypothetical protein LTR66_015735 [Elasticomyces elasticus]|nr:hypothetical protein LTR66_015735 [Elasticomyces elasticus]
MIMADPSYKHTIVTSTATVQLLSQTPAGWSDPNGWLTQLLAGKPSTILLALIVAISLPVLLHLYHITQIKTKKGLSSDGIPLFLLCGPQASGKTALVTLLQRRTLSSGAIAVDEDDSTGEKCGRLAEAGEEKITNGNGHAMAASPTRLSQTSSTVGLALPAGTPLGSNRYRSENDHETVRSMREATPYKIVDTPGHGKLRGDLALGWLSRPASGLRGVIFMLDSAAIETEGVLKDMVGYLHDVLLGLQRRRKTVKSAGELRVLIAANKQDLFTALPAGAVKAKLELELEGVRVSRRKGVSAVDAKEDVDEDEDAVLGGGGEGRFSFKLLEDEFEIFIDVLGGSVREDEGKGVRRWEEWIDNAFSVPLSKVLEEPDAGLTRPASIEARGLARQTPSAFSHEVMLS